MSKELIDKVKKAMKDLDYEPNVLAGSLRSKRSKTIGLLIPDSSNMFFAELSNNIEDILFSNGYNIIVSNSGYDLSKELEDIRSLRSKKTDGIIVIPASPEEEHLVKLKESGTPVVIIDRKTTSILVDTVKCDNFQGGYAAGKHLLGLGHTRIAYIDRGFDQSNSIERREGFLKSLKDNNINFNNGFYQKIGFKYEDGYQAVESLLKNTNKPTAIFTFGDIPAIGAARAIYDNGLEIPKDISLISYGDMKVLSYYNPRITAVHIPLKKMAVSSCELLINRIKGNETESYKEICFSTRLIVRESTSKPNL